MKQILIATIALAVLCGCRKNDVPQVLGYYSFKLSGTVDIEQVLPPKDSTNKDAEQPKPKTYTLKITPEIGQLSILQDNRFQGKAIATMNTTGGGVIIGDAAYYNRKVIISLVDKDLTFTNNSLGIIDLPSGIGDALTSFSHPVDLLGEGERLNETLILEFKAAADTLKYRTSHFVIKSSKIECVAKINK